MKEPFIVPLPNRTNVSIVCEKLEELIAEGFWKSDERILSEAELSCRFNVGRSTIREALNMLKAKNLIYTVPGRGTFISPEGMQEHAAARSYIPDPKSTEDLLNVMELRLSLEPMNAAFAARRATKALIEEMNDRQEELLHHNKPDMFAESDLAFHMLIAKATANPMLEDAMQTVRTFFLKQQIITSQAEWRRSQAGKFHCRILEAVTHRDDIGAEGIMREHMEDTYLYVKSIVGGNARQSGRWNKRKGGRNRSISQS